LAYVCEKSLKRGKPSLTNRDAPPPVTRVLRVIGIQATLFHACPRMVFRRMTHPVCAIVRGSPPELIWAKASATSAVAGSQRMSTDCRLSAAVAATQVHVAIPGGVGVTQHQPPTELLPSVINRLWRHEILLNQLSIPPTGREFS